MNPNVPRRAGRGRGDPTETIKSSYNNFSCRVCVCMRTRVLLRHFVAAFVLQKLPSRVEKKRPLVMKMGQKTSRCFKVRFELPLRGINAVSTPTPRARLTVATFRSTLFRAVWHPIVGILFRDISFRDKMAKESRFEEVIDMNHIQ